jgi:glycerol kinase
MSRYILSLDQGTTSSRAIVFNRAGDQVAVAQQEFPQLYPAPAHVEHDPIAIWSTELGVAREAIERAGAAPADIAAIGITNQRETTVLWERDTGRPVANAIVWQSRVSTPICDQLKREGCEDMIRAKTGLVVDAYFSGTKIKHLLDTISGLRQRAAKGEVLFGTIDSFLIWRLTGGRVHATDYSNASRTLIFNIHTLDWDDDLLRLLDIPRAMLPSVRSSSEIYGSTELSVIGAAIPIAGVAGDQQAATFGQACFEAGTAKNTYGTGCFMLLNTGEAAVASKHGLLTTIGWGVNGRITYCLEGAVFVAGAAVQWLRDGLGAIRQSADVEPLMASVQDTAGVYLVPAFVGLGAPHWDSSARGAILGITRGTTMAHIARAAVESMAYQSCDVLRVMEKDAGLKLSGLRVDGGATVNDHLLQFQADLLGVPISRPVGAEATARGAAFLAGLAVGYWSDFRELSSVWKLDREFRPSMDQATRDRLYSGWQKAVSRARTWA